MRADAPLLVTEALVRGAAGLPVPQDPPVTLDDGVWLEVVRLASAHLVLPALRQGLAAAGCGWAIGEEASAYLAAIETANAERNRMLRSALEKTVRCLQAEGTDPVIVKGGAFIAESRQAAPWRFLSDLDLIVPAAGLATAVAALGAAGFTATAGDYDPSRDAHAPAMLAPDGLTVVELHGRPFAARAAPQLEIALRDRSLGVMADGVALRIPSPEARLAYLLLHSQQHHAYHVQHRLLLRDLLDLAMLAPAPSGLDVAGALDLVPAEAQEGARALLAAAEAFGVRMPGIIFSPSQRRWAMRARRRLARPVFHRQCTGALDLLRHEARRLVVDRGRTLRLARELAAPTKIRRKLLKKLRELQSRVVG